MRFGPKAALGAAALAGVFALGTSAHAYLASFTIDANAKCKSAKIKTITKGAAAYAGCYSKVAVDPACLSKVSGKNIAAFGKLDAKPPCATTGDGVARDASAAAYALALDTAVGHGQKCDSAKTKTLGKHNAAIGGCYAKAAAKAPGTVDPACTSKALGKLTAALAKIETKPPCSTSGNGAALTAQADAFTDAQACLLAPGNPGCSTCGNGLNDPGEKCDASAPSAGWATCGADFTCTACNCACPTKIKFTGNASAPESLLDTGWTGISHRSPIVSNGTATITMSCSATSRPCGTCSVGGPIANGPGEIANQRCNGDTQVKCTSAPGGVAGCGGPLGTCEFFFGSNLPLAAGGVSVCAVNQINGSVSGTANVETGAASTVANLTSRVYNGGGATIDNPCPRCISGFCNGGMHPGGVCVADGNVPARPDYGSTSLDCPPLLAALVATLPIDLSNATGPVTKTLDASSPNCSGVAGEKCLCDTCNNAAATPCDSNADCTAVGATVCSGKRCLGGANDGTPCTSATACASGICDRPGQPTQPSACVDDSIGTPGVLDCLDPDLDGEGVCTGAPIDNNCSVASGHAQRGCTGATEVVDCGGVGTCISTHRNCFLTGGFTGPAQGTDNLTAVGAASVPMADTSNPTIAAVFCVGPTGATAVNSVSGLPGPGRATIKGAASGHP